MTVHDYGAGLTVDELIGMSVWHIAHLKLPSGEVFRIVKFATKILLDANLESFILVELWEDGHSVWQDYKKNVPLVVTPTGQIFRKKP
jgi:hypothetical protein